MTRALLRIAIGGILTALALLVGGVLLARTVLGADARDAQARIEAEVRQAFDAMTIDLREVARRGGSPEDLRLATTDDPVANQAAMRLFAAAADAVRVRQGFDLSLTLYRLGARPVAWAGRPTELATAGRLADESWFLNRGELGVRLVYIAPVETIEKLKKLLVKD